VPVLDRLIEDPDLAGALAALATEVVSARRLEAEAVATLREAEIDSLIARTAEERGILFNY